MSVSRYLTVLSLVSIHSFIHSFVAKFSAYSQLTLSLFSAWPSLTLGQVVLLFNSSTALLSMITLNRKPTTLANWDHSFYFDLWSCVSKRACEAASAGDGDRAGREYETASAMFAMYRSRKKPAFEQNCGQNIVPNLDYLYLAIDRHQHIESAMNGKPIALPGYLDEILHDKEHGWQYRLAHWLKVNDDANVRYSWREITLSDGKLSGEITVTWFYHETAGDCYHASCYAAIDGSLYDLTGSSIDDCSILETSIGWYVTDLRDEPLPDNCRTDTLSAGHSRNPTYQLERMLKGGSQPVYHWGLGCFVGRLETFPRPVKLWPESPCYGG